MPGVLVFLEHNGSEVEKASRSAVTAARELANQHNCPVVAVVLGSGIGSVLETAKHLPVDKLVAIDDPRLERFLADSAASALLSMAQQEQASAVIGAATSRGRDFFPRVAALLNAGMASDVILINKDGSFVRPVFAGSALETVRVDSPVQVLSIRASEFSAAESQAAAVSTALAAFPENAESKLRFVSFEKTRSERPALADANIVVAGGRGLSSAENFHAVLGPLADVLGAALGASRPAVDSGWVPNDFQVGQTGKVVAPELYIAAGISGAIQHLAGMKDARVIVAINKDAGATIFEYADYGLVADLFEAVPQLTSAIRDLRS